MSSKESAESFFSNGLVNHNFFKQYLPTMKYFSALFLLAVALFFSMNAFGQKQYITYEEFGAKGDGQTNDMPAIIQAHEAANEQGIPVKAKSKACYYIGDTDKPAVIKTDTDFQDSEFIIDDTALDFNNRRVNIFEVRPDKESYSVEIPNGLELTATNVGKTFECPVLLVLANKDETHFIRYGANQNNGSPSTDSILVDKQGNISKDTPLAWPFHTVTSATAFPTDDKPIVIKGGTFTTIANQAESKYNYYGRGIVVTRSHTTLAGIKHLVQGEKDHGAPYNGFFYVRDCADVILKNLVVTGHMTYKTIGAAGTSVSMGSYDLGAYRAINLSFLNVKQSNSITDRKYWGVLGTNFCRNLLYDHCIVSRFDAHQGVYNATIRNSEIGHQGIQLIGYGTFLLENTQVHSWSAISLRSDFGAFWRGKIIIRNCDLDTLDKNGVPFIITGNHRSSHNFGYECVMPSEILIDGLTILDGAEHTYNGPSIFGRFDSEFKPGKIDKYPNVRPKLVEFRNILIESGMPLRTAVDTEYFADTQFKDTSAQ